MVQESKKMPLSVRIGAFAASVIALSWFFAGWRQVNEAPAVLLNWLLLVLGTVSTLFLIGLQGYWIYFEEKAKGTLRKKIGLYEKIHDALARRSEGPCVGDGAVGGDTPPVPTRDKEQP